jgi:hypothetical protein
MFKAQIIGIERGVPNKEKFRLTGEKSASAIAGFPTVNRHHGTNSEMAINRRVAMPPAKPIQLSLRSINSAS